MSRFHHQGLGIAVADQCIVVGEPEQDVELRAGISYTQRMNTAIAFDTHRFVKRLVGKGFTEAQAEVLADEQVTLLNDNLATKQDMIALKTDMIALKAELEQQMATLKADLEQQMAALKADLEQQMTSLEGAIKLELATVKSDLLKWMIGALIAQGGLVVALVSLLNG